MKGFLLLLSFFAVLAVSAQKVMNRGASEASWKVLWGKKSLLKAAAEDEAANVVSIKRSALNKKNTFTILYTPAADQKSGWNRSIAAYDDADNVLKQQKGARFSVSSATLKAMAKGHNEIRIYTTAVPSDPAKAAVVRVRRVHLVTIRIV
ncbi:MAG: hypothetical protein EOO12_05945 [Chitinophagaceae bacterium]|nr:MAG: hypothetical protein EOO12_05945 [Chitinophagaceae bacterium]